ncbi:MAG TPA: hypothetical protein VEJ68_03280 [Candidatus Bathyarchaeia archaeon]|nr:hypothetical protein [Candidatus Bathyarchaeia archaeon]
MHIQGIYQKAKVGTAAGLIGGFAIILSFFVIDSSIGAPLGTFYTMIGLAVGLHGVNALIFGLFVHMLTAVTIGVVFCICSTLHPMLNLTSTWKGTFAGGVTGLEVYAIFFMPITLFIVLPAIRYFAMGSGDTALTINELHMISALKANLNLIVWGSLALHVLYGSTMGFFSSLMIHEEYKTKQSTTKQDFFTV